VTEPTIVTLLFRRRKGEPWRNIGSADSYLAALLLGERAGLHGGHWWFRTRHPEPAEIAGDNAEAKQPHRFE
jgi:hypothetical protein